MQPTAPPASNGATRTDERRAATAARILARAQELFVERGFDVVSMDMIAQAAGLSKVTVYKYFASKDELLTAIVLAFVDRTNRRIWPLDPGDLGMRSVLRTVATNFYGVFLSDDAIAFRRMVLGVLPRFPRLGRKIVDDGPGFLTGRLAAYFRRETEKGNADVADPELAAALFHGLMVSDIDMRGVYCSQAPSEAEIAKRVDLAVDMFVAHYRRDR